MQTCGYIDMALKKKLTADGYSKLSDTLKLLYIADGDNYVLDVEDEDTGALKRAKDRLSVEAKEARAEAKRIKDEKDALQQQLDELTGNDARKKGDIEKIDKAWQTKLDTIIAEKDGKLSARDKYLARLLVDGVAESIAKEVSIAPELMLPHIKSRLSAKLDDDEPSTIVLDVSGQPSKLSIADLKKEIMGDRRFASVIQGSKASGSTSVDGKTVTTQMTNSGSSEKVDLGTLAKSPKALGEHFAAKIKVSQ